MLKIDQLHAGYGKVEVLHGISVEVPKGRVVTLIGSNGAGKTTTMRAVSGMIAPVPGRSRSTASASTAWSRTTSRGWGWRIRRRDDACSPR